jgi:hypothetical protein
LRAMSEVSWNIKPFSEKSSSLRVEEEVRCRL